jgi:dihydroneopterin aldolase
MTDDTRRIDPLLASCRRIAFRKLRLHASIGVLPHEIRVRQPLLFDVDVYVREDATPPRQDRIDEVLDYRKVREAVLELAGSGHTNLLETLCDRIAERLLALPHVAAVRLTVEKPNAFDDTDAVGVEVLRFREEPR